MPALSDGWIVVATLGALGFAVLVVFLWSIIRHH